MNTDFETEEESYHKWKAQQRMIEMQAEYEVYVRDSLALIKCYVPESDVVCFEDALELAHKRDEQRAYELVANEAAI